MSNFKIGIMPGAFGLPLKDGIKRAAELGAQGIQVYGSRGEVNPDLTSSERAEWKDYITSLGLEVSAVCGELGGYGFQVKKDNPSQVEFSKRVISLAKDLGTNIITTHIGVVPIEKNEMFYTLREACYELACAAAAQDAVFAIETGPEKAVTLKALLDDIGVKGMGVNYDPANLEMVVGDDAVAGVYTLKDYIVHTHAKDGKMLTPCEPLDFYANFTEKFVDYAKFFLEVPLGQGSVDFDKYIAALRDIGYNGYLTIEREVGDTPDADIKMAVDFLREKIK